VAQLHGEAQPGHLVLLAEFQARGGKLALFGHRGVQEAASFFIQIKCPVPGA